jgi:polar amino acid transport system substrate-binding protein
MRATALALIAAVLAGPAAAQTLDRLRENGEIRLGYRADAAPLSFADDAGLPAGYTVRVCEAVAERLAEQLGLDDLATTWVQVTTDDRFEAVADGRIDLLCGAASITLERREVVDFSIPTFVDGAAVLLPAGAEPNFAALAGKRIGVHAGTTTEEILRNSLDAEQMDAEVVTFDSHPAGLDALVAGEIDAYFGDQSILFGLARDREDREQLSMSDTMLTVEKQGLALPRGDTDFRLAVDRALGALYADGSMAEFFNQALPGAEPGLALRALFLIAPDMP